MTLVKCPRCELNYILDGGSLCTVCRKEVRGESVRDDVAELCSECGENPALPGSELCAACMKEMTRHVVEETDDEHLDVEDPTLEIDSVATMDEIDLGDTIEDDAFDDEAFKDEADEEDLDAEDEDKPDDADKFGDMDEVSFDELEDLDDDDLDDLDDDSDDARS